MLSGVAVVGAVEIADQPAPEVVPQEPVQHGVRPAAVTLDVANRGGTGGGQQPDIAVLLILPPTGLIPIQNGTGLRLGLARPGLSSNEFAARFRLL